MKRRQTLLVTTALEETWGKEENILFLGEWCKLYKRRDVWSQRDYETVSFHWDDREKLRKDYSYLESLHHTLLRCLVEALNKLHGVNHSVRYWQILLDPWLLSYLSVAFDRWECLRRAIEENSELQVISLQASDASLAQFSYSEFIDAVLSDEWNQYFCQRILENEYSGNCSIRPVEFPRAKQLSAPLRSSPKRRINMFRMIALSGDHFLKRIFPRCDIFFLGTRFNFAALTRLNLALGQVPRLFFHEFGSPMKVGCLPISNESKAVRASICLDFQAGNPFEKFVKIWVMQDMPTCLIEHYQALRARAKDLTIKTKAIVTAGNHWVDVFAKFWFAEQTNRGVKLIIAEHGGSLPPYKELFDFEDDIADAKATWFTPYHQKQTQLPAAKIIGRFKKMRALQNGKSGGEYCSVIGNECGRWVHRAHFYPMAGQWLHSFNMVLKLREHLDEEVEKYFRVKPYPGDLGWNTALQFSDILGLDKLLEEKNLDRVFSDSRVIVCTYPETTFAEAMASGLPTILVYPESFYELNSIALPLFEILKSANIVFSDSKAAASHLNSIWRDPYHWWDSDLVRRARKEFGQQALDIEGDWLYKWKGFLQSVVRDVTL
jgi:putative transferase (TIGR04331 family)